MGNSSSDSGNDSGSNYNDSNSYSETVGRAVETITNVVGDSGPDLHVSSPSCHTGTSLEVVASNSIDGDAGADPGSAFTASMA
jgi:hypothetical protein